MNSLSIDHFESVNNSASLTLGFDQMAKCESVIQSDLNIAISSYSDHIAGLSAEKELSILLYQCCSFLDQAKECELLEVGVNSFVVESVAKLRALKFLLKEVLKTPMKILAKSNINEWTVFEEKINLLRAESHYCNALWGGADFFETFTFDHFYQQKDVSSKRLQATLPQILCEESHLDKVADPFKGSEVIEKRTKEIIEKTIEKLKSFSSMDVFTSITDKWRSEAKEILQSEINDRKKIVTGVNKFINENQVVTPKDINLNLEIYSIEKIRVAVGSNRLTYKILNPEHSKVSLAKLNSYSDLLKSYGLIATDQDVTDFYLDFENQNKLGINLLPAFDDFNHQSLLLLLNQNPQFRESYELFGKN